MIVVIRGTQSARTFRVVDVPADSIARATRSPKPRFTSRGFSFSKDDF